MIFHAERYCAPASFFEYSGTEAASLGENGRLSVVLLSSGQCTILEQPHPMVVCAGTLLVTAEQLHFSPLQSCHMIGVTLCGAAPGEAAAQLHAPALLDAACCPDAPDTLYRLVAGQEDSAASQSALAYSLLCQLSGQAPRQKPLPPLIASAVAEIREHYAEVYGVAELAVELSVSKSHLVRSFTAAVGVSPGRYLAAVRLDAAKRLLLHREYTLETIASLCGFAGANYFCRVFKKETGKTPAAWRAKALPGSLPAPTVNEWEEQLYL